MNFLKRSPLLRNRRTPIAPRSKSMYKSVTKSTINAVHEIFTSSVGCGVERSED